jgi:hypothetical protein
LKGGQEIFLVSANGFIPLNISGTIKFYYPVIRLTPAIFAFITRFV